MAQGYRHFYFIGYRNSYAFTLSKHVNNFLLLYHCLHNCFKKTKTKTKSNDLSNVFCVIYALIIFNL